MRAEDAMELRDLRAELVRLREDLVAQVIETDRLREERDSLLGQLAHIGRVSEQRMAELAGLRVGRDALQAAYVKDGAELAGLREVLEEIAGLGDNNPCLGPAMARAAIAKARGTP